VSELDQEWESLLEKALLAEPVVEEEQVWMPLAEDEGLEEIAALPMAEEAPALTEMEAPAELEEPPVELPDWALAEAVEVAPEGLPSMAEEITLGPDLVLLTEEEEVQAMERAEQARAVPADLGELLPELEEPIGEEAEVVAETPLAEPELPGKPTWVAVEEEAVEEELVVPAPSVEEQPVTADDDEVGLALARRLWVTGEEENARTAYERLLTSRLRDAVIEDLERITTEEAPRGSMLRLLGDAYMKADRLQEALAAYRRALAGY
jgi:tetratricopeptide (TPR) repeat protein